MDENCIRWRHAAHGRSGRGFGFETRVETPLFMTLSVAGIWFFMGQPTEPTRTYLKRPQGILYLIWISIFCAWFIHEGNWIPGICIGGALILGLIGGTAQTGRRNLVAIFFP